MEQNRIPRKKEGGKRAETARKQRRYWQEEELDVVLEEQNVCVLETPDTRIALASISRQWFDDPQKELCIIGVTGTKGKTTTVWMIWKMLAAPDMKRAHRNH